MFCPLDVRFYNIKYSSEDPEEGLILAVTGVKFEFCRLSPVNFSVKPKIFKKNPVKISLLITFALFKVPGIYKNSYVDFPAKIPQEDNLRMCFFQRSAVFKLHGASLIMIKNIYPPYLF
eukprot:snap_masked-scaffold_1-processed-gene-22.32-mRNA-1 protein AED:1.00 eAED:1.00 QI:0/0/0/0/1/1/2/0/118